MGATAPFWRFSAASYPDLKEQAPVNVLRGSKKGDVLPPNEKPAGVRDSLLLRLLNLSLKLLTFLSDLALCHFMEFNGTIEGGYFLFLCGGCVRLFGTAIGNCISLMVCRSKYALYTTEKKEQTNVLLSKGENSLGMQVKCFFVCNRN